MSKAYTSTCGLSQIADAAGISTAEVRSLFTQMVTDGHVEAFRADLPDPQVNLLEALAMLSYGEITATLAFAVGDQWATHCLPASKTISWERKAAHLQSLAGKIFDMTPPAIKALEDARREPGRVTERALCAYGMRIDHNDPARVWVAAPHPHFSQLCRKAGVPTRDLTESLMTLPGAVRVGPKSFNPGGDGIYRAVGVGIGILLSSVKGGRR